VTGRAAQLRSPWRVYPDLKTTAPFDARGEPARVTCNQQPVGIRSRSRVLDDLAVRPMSEMKVADGKELESDARASGMHVIICHLTQRGPRIPITSAATLPRWPFYVET
jgi:hypothetical protein